MIWVAIVANIHEGNQGMSKRPNGDWAAFVAADKTTAIQRAMAAKKAWAKSVHSMVNEYTIYVGTLTDAETLYSSSGWQEAKWPELSPSPLPDEDISF